MNFDFLIHVDDKAAEPPIVYMSIVQA